MSRGMDDCLLLIFIRNPELGKCKTRLARKIGNENALEVYKALLNHTVKITKDIQFDKAIYYSVKVRKNDMWDEDIYLKFEQKGSDLGERMLNAFKDSFYSGYKRVVIAGSDILDLNKEHLEKAFHLLKSNDVVIGPAEDGGYYLLGMNQLHSTIFLDKKWGTPSVLKDTIKELKNHKVELLEVLNDIDTYSDMHKHSILKPFLEK